MAFAVCSNLRSVEFGPYVSKIQVSAFDYTAWAENDIPEKAIVKPTAVHEYPRPEGPVDDDLPF